MSKADDLERLSYSVYQDPISGWRFDGQREFSLGYSRPQISLAFSSFEAAMAALERQIRADAFDLNPDDA